MNSKLRNAVITAVVVLLVPVATALNNSDLVTYLDVGASWVSSQAQQEVLLASADPMFVGTGGAAAEATQVNEQLKKELENLGILVD